jgi:hypothetical protein
MKKAAFFLFVTLIFFWGSSCEILSKDDDNKVLEGDQSALGETGTTFTSSTIEISGVKDFAASVASLSGGVSSFSATATVTNDVLKNMVSNFPGVVVNGNQVSITDMKMQITTEGIKCLTGPGEGIIVKYDSEVGDTYPIGSSDNVRKVVSKSTTDDYSYGFLMIKTIQVESSPSNLKSMTGVSKITYIANHRFGLVGVKLNYEDGSSASFPVYSSAENK